MKIAAITTIFAAAIGSVAAAPAMIWQKGVDSVFHSSESTDSNKLIAKTIKANKKPESLASVIFVVNRDEDGAEGLSLLASAGELPQTQSKVGEASVYHYMTGVRTPRSVVFDARHGADNVELLSMEEYPERLQNLEDSKDTEVMVVDVPMHSAEIFDKAVIDSIAHSQIASVIVTAQRSDDEIALERDFMLIERERQNEKDFLEARRRLEDNNNNNNNNNNNDDSSTYYVHMTPNILSGILFTLFFIVVTQIGVGCMNQISFSEVYVEKYPTIGREN